MENDTSKTASVPDLGHDDVGGQECKDGRSRTWMILLYEDNDNMKRVLQETLKELDWNYAGRIHDQEGKPHHHVVVLFKDGRKAKDVAADIGLETRWLRAWDKKKRALRYLCHRDNPEKFQYDTDGIYGTIAEQAIAACAKSDGLSEAQSVVEIINILDSIEGHIDYSVALKLMAEKGCFSVFRRMGVLGVRLLDEHNYKVSLDSTRRNDTQADIERFGEHVRQGTPWVKRCQRLDYSFPPKGLNE